MADQSLATLMSSLLPGLARRARALTGNEERAGDLIERTLMTLAQEASAPPPHPLDVVDEAASDAVDEAASDTVDVADEQPYEVQQLRRADRVMFGLFLSPWRLVRRPREALVLLDSSGFALDGDGDIESRYRLRSALDALPALERAILVATDLLGEDDEETTRLVDRPIEVVNAARERALTRLRSAVTDRGAAFTAMLMSELTHAASGPQLHAEPMLDRVRHRQRRQVVYRRVSACVALLATLVMSANLLTGGVSTPIAFANPTTTSGAVAAGATPESYGFWPGVVQGMPIAPVGGDFVDLVHGYLTVVRCEATGNRCRVELATTADGGDHWTRRKLPGQPAFIAESSFQVLRVGSTMVYSCLAIPGPGGCGPTAASSGNPIFVSSDQGQTWREVARSMIYKDRLPGGPPVLITGDRNGRLMLAAVASDGTVTLLRGAPVDRLTYGYNVRQLADGTIVLWGPNEDRGGSIWISRDRGRSWTHAATPYRPPDTDASGMERSAFHLYTRDARTIYVVPPIGEAVYRSRNGGQSWQRVPVPRLTPRFPANELFRLTRGYAEDDPTHMYMSAAEVADGGLLITRAGHLLRLAPDAAEPVAWTKDGFAGLRVIQAGNLVIAIDAHAQPGDWRLSHSVRLTGDGKTWWDVVLF